MVSFLCYKANLNLIILPLLSDGSNPEGPVFGEIEKDVIVSCRRCSSSMALTTSKERIMLRRAAFVSLALVMVLAMFTAASAAPNVANATQKGSLLVFPWVMTLGFVNDPTNPLVDTYIFIGNDQASPTYVKCYWMDSNQSVEDFHFMVTANQPVVFSAGAGASQILPFGLKSVGSLVCWAQDAGDQNPQSFNHLYGYALVVNALNATNTFYNAYAFALRGSAPVAPNNGTLPLDGVVYDACPKYLITTFIADPTLSGYDDPALALWPCKQDLTQDRDPTCTKAKFDVWNGNEVKFTGAYQCFKCYFEGILKDIAAKASLETARSMGPGFGGERFSEDIPWRPPTGGPGFGGEKFTQEVLKTQLGRLRVQGVRSSVCFGKTGTPSGSYLCPDSAHVNTPLLGVLMYAERWVVYDPNDSPPVSFWTPADRGYTLFGAGQDPSGFIKWDPSIDVEKPKQ